MRCLICKRRGARLKIARRTIGTREVELCDECARSLFAVEAVERRLLAQAAAKDGDE